MTEESPMRPKSKLKSGRKRAVKSKAATAQRVRRFAPRLPRKRESAPDMPLWARPGYLLRRLHQIHYALFFQECARFDITPVQYGLLSTLQVNPDLDQNSLGRELGIDRTNVADVLNRLERRGFLERRRGPNDRRTMLTRLTPAGERLTKRMYPRDASLAGDAAQAAAARGAGSVHRDADPADRRQQSSRPHDLRSRVEAMPRFLPCARLPIQP